MEMDAWPTCLYLKAGIAKSTAICLRMGDGGGDSVTTRTGDVPEVHAPAAHTLPLPPCSPAADL